jgi:hypothetical protein
MDFSSVMSCGRHRVLERDPRRGQAASAMLWIAITSARPYHPETNTM